MTLVGQWIVVRAGKRAAKVIGERCTIDISQPDGVYQISSHGELATRERDCEWVPESPVGDSFSGSIRTEGDEYRFDAMVTVVESGKRTLSGYIATASHFDEDDEPGVWEAEEGDGCPPGGGL